MVAPGRDHEALHCRSLTAEEEGEYEDEDDGYMGV